MQNNVIAVLESHGISGELAKKIALDISSVIGVSAKTTGTRRIFRGDYAEAITTRFDWGAPREQWRPKTTSECMAEIGIDGPAIQFGNDLRNIAGQGYKSNGRKVRLMPPAKKSGE